MHVHRQAIHPMLPLHGIIDSMQDLLRQDLLGSLEAADPTSNGADVAFTMISDAIVCHE